MPNITSAQAKELAKYYLSMAQDINAYRIEKWDFQTPEQRHILSDLHWKITNYVDDFIALSTTLILEDIQGDLHKIQTITEEITSTIHKIEMVQKVINISTAVVALAVAIISKNLPGIGKGIASLAKAVTAKLPSEIKEEETGEKTAKSGEQKKDHENEEPEEDMTGESGPPIM